METTGFLSRLGFGRASFFRLCVEGQRSHLFWNQCSCCLATSTLIRRKRIGTIQQSYRLATRIIVSLLLLFVSILFGVVILERSREASQGGRVPSVYHSFFVHTENIILFVPAVMSIKAVSPIIQKVVPQHTYRTVRHSTYQLW